LAVAPVGSVLLAVTVAADFEGVVVLAAAAGDAATVAAGAGAAGAAAAAGAAVEATAGWLVDPFCTPPWPLHAPRPVDEEVVPSLQVLVPPDAAGAAGAAGVAAGAAAAAGAAEEPFWTPPWPLHAPRPVAEEVVPSLQVVGAGESAAVAGNAVATPRASSDAAMVPHRLLLFIRIHSLVLICPRMNCKRIRAGSSAELWVRLVRSDRAFSAARGSAGC
jgi:hypothetical protein